MKQLHVFDTIVKAAIECSELSRHDIFSKKRRAELLDWRYPIRYLAHVNGTEVNDIVKLEGIYGHKPHPDTIKDAIEYMELVVKYPKYNSVSFRNYHLMRKMLNQNCLIVT